MLVAYDGSSGSFWVSRVSREEILRKEGPGGGSSFSIVFVKILTGLLGFTEICRDYRLGCLVRATAPNGGGEVGCAYGWRGFWALGIVWYRSSGVQLLDE